MKTTLKQLAILAPLLFFALFINNKFCRNDCLETNKGIFVHSNPTSVRADACLIATDGKACLQLENYCIYIEDDNLVIRNLNGEKRIVQCIKEN
jgi:hypothetical protein